MALFDPLKRVLRNWTGPDVSTSDSVVNFQARIGIGADNLSQFTSYAVSTVSRNRQTLDSAYRGSWLVGVAVDSVADDMTSAGIDLKGGVDPGDASNIENTWNDLCIWQGLADAIRWSRLYGGAIAVILIDGQDLKSELRVDRIAKDAFKGLLVLDRWMITPSQNDLVQDFGPDMGLPRYYTVNTNATMGVSGATAPVGAVIHYSRCIRFDGDDLPFMSRQTEQGWGQSVIERMYDRLLAYDSATQGAAQLVFKAYLRTLSVEGLREALAYGGVVMEGVARNVDAIRKFQSSDGITLLDTKDKFETYTYNFGGLTDLLHQFGEQMAGSIGVPMVRLYGQSPSGFNSGDADMQHYEDKIGTRQNKNLRRPVGKLIAVTASSRRIKLPDGWTFKFRPLTKMSATERVDIAAKVTAAVVQAETQGLISQQTAMMELKASSEVTGIFATITQEQIDAAEPTIPNPNDMGEPELGDDADQGPFPDEDGSEYDDPDLPDSIGISVPTGDYATIWQESKHKRGQPGNAGQFGSGSNGATPAAGGGRRAADKAGADGSKQRPTRATGQGNPNLAETGIKDGKRVMADGSALPPHIEALKLPPAWTGVRISADPKAALLAQGRDAKGRVQSVYSQEFSATQAAAKFARVRELAAAFDGITAKNDTAQKSTNAKTKDAADCLALVMKTGIRPGSDDDTGAEKQAYGATTLQGQHVVQEGDSTFLRFTGKKGVALNLQIGDAEIASMLKERAATAGPDGKLFPAVTDKSLLEHTKSVAGDQFKTKDFRTHLGTATAASMVRSMATPTDEKAHRRQVMEVAKAVSAKLGNTPTIALQSYIAPEVFGAWAGASKPQQEAKN